MDFTNKIGTSRRGASLKHHSSYFYRLGCFTAGVSLRLPVASRARRAVPL